METQTIENHPETTQIAAMGLSKTYSGRKVVNGVSFHVNQGEVVGLLGPNGAGKTTSFYMMVGLVKSEDGRILIKGRDVTRKPMHKRARMGVGYLSQESSIFRKMTVQNNILAILETTPKSHSERKLRLQELLSEFKLEKVHKTLAYSLSGGERRRLEIARALATDPDFLLLDEPFAGIDPIAVEDIQAMILSLKQKGMGILITDHNVRETLAITQRSYIMFEGKVLVEGNSAHLANDPEARRIYLGQSFSL